MRIAMRIALLLVFLGAALALPHPPDPYPSLAPGAMSTSNLPPVIRSASNATSPQALATTPNQTENAPNADAAAAPEPPVVDAEPFLQKAGGPAPVPAPDALDSAGPVEDGSDLPADASVGLEPEHQLEEGGAAQVEGPDGQVGEGALTRYDATEDGPESAEELAVEPSNDAEAASSGIHGNDGQHNYHHRHRHHRRRFRYHRNNYHHSHRRLLYRNRIHRVTNDRRRIEYGTTFYHKRLSYPTGATQGAAIVGSVVSDAPVSNVIGTGQLTGGTSYKVAVAPEDITYKHKYYRDRKGRDVRNKVDRFKYRSDRRRKRKHVGVHHG
ncbi:hypothetical protein HK101_001408 [Irineochytrium annulatum]|nr:hypothetical protein HK101_001408 [Irineochytrium annulatum]